MPYYANTIVKVRYVCPSTKEDSNLITLWAISTYLVGCEDNVIEMVLFVLNNSDERDFETQAIFERDGYYSVGDKIVPGIYEGKKRPKMTVSISTHVMILNKAPESNKCPLRIFLIGVAQESPNVLKNNENAIFNMMINDYAGQDCNFIVKVVFPHLNSRFLYLKNTIRPQKSLVFIIGQLEVIYNDFYIYAKDISIVNTSSFKRRIFDNSFSNLSDIINTTWSKLLSTYRNINESQKGIDKFETSFPNVSNDSVYNNFQLASCFKCMRTEYSDESTDVFNDTSSNDMKLGKVNNLNEVAQNDCVGNVSGDKKYKKSKNDKKGVGHHLHSNSRLLKSDMNIVNSE
ncbi:2635_t:CDS:2 [Scutellospora calospora]|uniref:2635_t:CDS:1 n=1 Tax=Scutellospora calospora TaxID=85575 RepID=A0ACA9KLS0_9GLOM|nr:2635_t:CDS:2 [Scutellospora calospora]